MRPFARSALAVFAAAAALACGPARAQHVTVDAALDHGVFAADAKTPAWLRVGLVGHRSAGGGARPTVNVAIVFDKSGSMTGKKIEQAKLAARAALERLGPDDIVSVVAYDSTVEVLVPATRVRDRESILRGIDRLRAGGMTALFAGTSKGAAEIRKFADKTTIDRIILLSDGQANVGPQAPGDLARLGEALRREKIGVTTLGLGLDYNEDLMVALAQKSGGNHFFVEDPSQLAAMFREGFGGLTSIVAQEAVVKITFAEGVRPVRALGFDADILGQTLTANLAQIYGGSREDLLVELELSPQAAGRTQPIARIAVSYHDAVTQAVDRVETSVGASFASDRGAIEASLQREVMALVVERVAQEKSRLAVELRDQGRVDEARAVLQKNKAWLDGEAARLRSERLRKQAQMNDDDARGLDDPAAWNRRRKDMQFRNNTRDFERVDF